MLRQISAGYAAIRRIKSLAWPVSVPHVERITTNEEWPSGISAFADSGMCPQTRGRETGIIYKIYTGKFTVFLYSLIPSI